MGVKHPGLFRKSLKIKSNSINWLREDMRISMNQERKHKIRIRHRQSLQTGVLKMQNKFLYIFFEKNQRGIAKGQFAAWYHNNELIGSGPIN